MSTRAAAVATSQRAKQRLVSLLFQSEYGGRGQHAHKKLDFASYSYCELKAAYLKRVQSIHPDKVGHLNLDLGLEEDDTTDNDRVLTDTDISSTSTSTSTSTSSSWNETASWKDVVEANKKAKKKVDDDDKCHINRRDASAFIELQDAWAKYEKVSKLMRRGRDATESQIRGVQEDFTAFGVGCSFSDSVEESIRRADIMDQAGKGWCAAGQLGEGGVDEGTDGKANSNRGMNVNIPLVGDDLFSDVNAKEGGSDYSASKSTAGEALTAPSRRKSLVDDLVPRFIIR